MLKITISKINAAAPASHSDDFKCGEHSIKVLQPLWTPFVRKVWNRLIQLVPLSWNRLFVLKSFHLCLFWNVAAPIKGQGRREGKMVAGRKEERQEGRKKGRELMVASVFVLHAGKVKGGGCPNPSCQYVFECVRSGGQLRVNGH